MSLSNSPINITEQMWIYFGFTGYQIKGSNIDPKYARLYDPETIVVDYLRNKCQDECDIRFITKDIKVFRCKLEVDRSRILLRMVSKENTIGQKPYNNSVPNFAAEWRCTKSYSNIDKEQVFENFQQLEAFMYNNFPNSVIDPLLFVHPSVQLLANKIANADAKTLGVESEVLLNNIRLWISNIEPDQRQEVIKKLLLPALESNVLWFVFANAGTRDTYLRLGSSYPGTFALHDPKEKTLIKTSNYEEVLNMKAQLSK